MHRKKTISFGILTSRDGYYFRKVISVSVINYSKEFTTLCRDKSKEKYKISDIHGMHERTETEICNAIKSKSTLLFLAAHEVIEYCKNTNIPYGNGFSSKFHLLAYYLGISEVNPLPCHYECKCGNFEWVRPRPYFDFYETDADGFDMPDKECPFCKKAMHGDGHNLPESEDEIHSINIPVKSEFKDEIIAYLKEKFNGFNVRNLKHVDKDNITHELKYSLSVMPAECELPDDCFTEPIPYGILVLSDYEPLADLSLLSKTTNTDLSTINFNDSRIYDSFYHYEDDAMCGECSVYGHLKLPVDFFVFEKAENFSDFVRRLGILKFLNHLPEKSHDSILGGWESKGCQNKRVPINQVPYCIEEFIDTLARNYFDNKEISKIIAAGKSGKPASKFIAKNYVQWFRDLADNCRYLDNKQNLIAEAMEIYRTQYFAENYPLQFFKCKINEMRK